MNIEERRLKEALESIFKLLDNLKYERLGRISTLDEDAMSDIHYCKDLAELTLQNYNKKYVYEEYGTATGVRFCTSEGIKTMEAGKLYDKDLNEI